MILFSKKTLVLVFLAGLCQLALAQINITGTITDADGFPLIGASVVEKGTVNGTVTNIDGNYNIAVANKESVLVYSFIGYETTEQIVGDRSNISFQLLLNMEELTEVMVVGYGVQKKSDITGAIVSVKADEIGKTSAVNAISSLQGKAAGVEITSNSGTPGGSVKVRIRGVGTIGDSNPLYVVDGFPTTDIEFLNPADIESMEVLKDASASAIYGARGANGVILITTKSGKKGGSKITYSSYYGVQKIPSSPNIANGPEYYELMKEMYGNADKTFSLRSSTPEGFEYAGDTTHTTNWFNELTRPAPMQNHDLSISGGNEKLNYHISGSLYKQDGTVKGSSFDRQTFRLNLNSQVNNWLEMGNQITLSNNKQTSVFEGSMYYGTVLNAMRTDPLTPIKNDSANLYYIPAYQDIENPVAAIEYDNYERQYFRSVGNIYAKVKITDDLSVKSSFGLDLNHSNTKNFIPTQIYLGTDKYDRPYNSVSRSHSKSHSWLNENTINYSKTIDVHNFTALAGFTMQEWISDWTSVEKDSIPKDIELLRYFNAATGEARATGSRSESAMLSYLGRVFYSYNEKYMITASIRADGSSQFGEENRYGIFPSVSMGWNILKEDFMTNIPQLSILKLRSGWGQIGNDRIGNYSYNAGVDYALYNSYILGGPNSAQYQVYGASPNNFGNPYLKWETVESTNIGIDYGLYDNRISGSFEYYIKNTKEMLVVEPVPEYVGFLTNPYSNIGEMQNRGFEISLTYKESIKEFKYNTTLNFSRNKNELVSLGKGQPIASGSIQAGYISLSDVGQPVGMFYGYITDGIFQNEEELTPTQPDAVPGDIRYVDLNADGTINDNDMTFLGSALPKFSYGLNFNAEYRSFDLSLFFQGSYGNKVFNATNWYLWHTSEQYNRSADLLNSWTEENSTDKFPRLSIQDKNGNNRISDRYIENGSYLRLKNLQLGYTLPQTMLSKVNIQQFRVYVSAQNLLTFTKYSGLDPEIGNLSSDLSAGIDLGTYPQVRIIQFGTKIVF